jgi:putative copper export protein
MAAVGGRFAVLVWLAIAGISVSGIYMAFTQTPLRAWRDLVATPYGKLLLVKIVLGVVIAKISLALTLPLQLLAGVQEQMLGLLWVNFFVAIAVTAIASRLRRGAAATT